MPPVVFALRTERDEILAATARAISLRGYADTTLDDIATEAGITRRRVLRTVGEVEDCFWAMFTWTFHLTFARVLKRTRHVPWPLSAREGLDEFLEIMALSPAYVRANMLGVRALGANGSLRMESA